MTIVTMTIQGEPASKANQRRFVRLKGKPAFIKSEKALNYEKTFKYQCKKIVPLIEDDCWVRIKIYYASRRPDLDESVILDCMQGRIYVNDRQVKEKHVIWGLDRDNPRAEIKVGLLNEIEPQDCRTGTG
jgi:Holliday junction resolvase RusA-like endonuclease